MDESHKEKAMGVNKFWPGTESKVARMRVESADGVTYPVARGADAILAAQRVLAHPRAHAIVNDLRVSANDGCVVRYWVPLLSDSVFADYERAESFMMNVMRGNAAEDV